MILAVAVSFVAAPHDRLFGPVRTAPLFPQLVYPR